MAIRMPHLFFSRFFRKKSSFSFSKISLKTAILQINKKKKKKKKMYFMSITDFFKIKLLITQNEKNKHITRKIIKFVIYFLKK